MRKEKPATSAGHAMWHLSWCLPSAYFAVRSFAPADTQRGGVKSGDVDLLSNSSMLLKCKSSSFAVTLRNPRVISPHEQARLVRYITIPRLPSGKILHYLVVSRL